MIRAAVIAGSIFALTACPGAGGPNGTGKGSNIVITDVEHAPDAGVAPTGDDGPPVQPGSGAASCARSSNNYASMVTRDLGANLTDVSCSGATTANVLTTGQNGKPPQISGVTSSPR